jgi:ergothioneine biosynthesis protein EgtB
MTRRQGCLSEADSSTRCLRAPAAAIDATRARGDCFCIDDRPSYDSGMHTAFAPSALDRSTLAQRLVEARIRLDALAATLPPEGWIGPYEAILNPPLWEYGHIVWFQELWCLRRKRDRSPHESPLLEPLAAARADWADWLYNSSYIPHTARWQAPLRSPDATRAYGREVLDAVGDRLARDDDPDLPYYAELSLHHETMHTEAWWMMWQWKAMRPPSIPKLARLRKDRSIAIDAGQVMLGAHRDAGFAFDNEKWAHEVAVNAFAIDAQPVSNGEFAAFIEAGGYADAKLWPGPAGQWRAAQNAEHPLYWRRAPGGWELRRFDQWIALPPDEPVIHVSRHEADAYARWRGRRLPSAAEWVRAAAHPSFVRGRCWEWTRDMFAPYLGFSPDPYADYSAPWFHTHCELRGAGSWVTDTALARPSYRNFYRPERRDPFVGFRTMG